MRCATSRHLPCIGAGRDTISALLRNRTRLYVPESCAHDTATLGLCLMCCTHAERSRGTIHSAWPSHSCQTGVIYGKPCSSIVATRATTGPAKNSVISSALMALFLPIQAGCSCLVLSAIVNSPIAVAANEQSLPYSNIVPNQKSPLLFRRRDFIARSERLPTGRLA